MSLLLSSGSLEDESRTWQWDNDETVHVDLGQSMMLMFDSH